MEPSIGRIVHYRTIEDAKHPKSEVVAAMITKVREDTGGVNLSCFMSAGFFFRKNVMQGDEPGQWQWPPRN